MSLPETHLTLQYPITYNGDTLEVLTLRRPHVKELRLLDDAQGDVAKMALMIGALAGLDRGAVDQLDVADFTAAGQLVTGFLPGALPTGAS